MRIGLDLDDTIADHSNNLSILAKECGHILSGSEVHIKKELKRLLSPVDYHDLKKKLFGPISLSATPIPGSLRILKKLMRNEAALYIISRRTSYEYAKRWIAAHLDFMPQENVIFVNEDSEKAAHCKNLKLEIFLDNKEGVLKHLTTPTEPILFDRWNEYPHSTFNRVASWEEFYKFCQRG